MAREIAQDNRALNHGDFARIDVAGDDRAADTDRAHRRVDMNIVRVVAADQAGCEHEHALQDGEIRFARLR